MAAETSPPPEVPSEAPGLTLQEEVELLRRQMRELQAQQNKPPSDPAPGPPPRRYP